MLIRLLTGVSKCGLAYNTNGRVTPAVVGYSLVRSNRIAPKATETNPLAIRASASAWAGFCGLLSFGRKNLEGFLLSISLLVRLNPLAILFTKVIKNNNGVKLATPQTATAGVNLPLQRVGYNQPLSLSVSLRVETAKSNLASFRSFCLRSISRLTLLGVKRVFTGFCIKLNVSLIDVIALLPAQTVVKVIKKAKNIKVELPDTAGISSAAGGLLQHPVTVLTGLFNYALSYTTLAQCLVWNKHINGAGFVLAISNAIKRPVSY